jgi:hypothetical protein
MADEPLGRRGDNEVPDDEERGSLVPFGAAVAVFVLVVVGVAVFTLTRGDGLTEEQRVGRAAVGQNDALQRQNYADYQRYTCSAEQGTEANMSGAQQESVRQHGARYVDDVTAVTINGDRATATVKYHYEKDPNGKDSTPLTFARQDGQWKVCSAYR